MTPETLAALKQSIHKWRMITDGLEEDRGTNNCALCRLFRRFAECGDCPVKQFSGRNFCAGTPYLDDWWSSMTDPQKYDFRYGHGNLVAINDEQKTAAKKEFDFLLSLLPPGETA